MAYYHHLLRDWTGGFTANELGGPYTPVHGCSSTYHKNGAELYLIACSDKGALHDGVVSQIYYDVDYAVDNELPSTTK